MERHRERGGSHDQRNEQVALLFKALGCPVLKARGEAEGLCAQMSKEGAVDIVCSSDSDVLPFGAEGLVLKTAKAGGAWQYVYVCKVQEAVTSLVGQMVLVQKEHCSVSVGSSVTATRPA